MDHLRRGSFLFFDDELQVEVLEPEAVVASLVHSFDAATARLDERISDLVVGDDYDLLIPIFGVPAGATLSIAWFTIKEYPTDPDQDALVQLVITPTSLDGQGQILDTGVSGTGSVLFQLAKEQTALLNPYQLYVYDVQVESSTGKYSTRQAGILAPRPQITQAT